MFALLTSQADDDPAFFTLQLHPTREPPNVFERKSYVTPPTKLYSVESVLMAGEFVLAGYSVWMSDNHGVNISLHVSADQVPNPESAIARSFIQEFRLRTILSAGTVFPGQKPDLPFATKAAEVSVDQIRVLGCSVKCLVESSKKKTLNSIAVDIFVQSDGSAEALLMAYVSKDGEIFGSLAAPREISFLTSDQRRVFGTQISRLNASVFAGDLQNAGIKVPSYKDISKIELHPFVAVYEPVGSLMLTTPISANPE